MRGDPGEGLGNGRSGGGDPDDLRLGDMRIVEKDRDDRRVWIADQQQQLLAAMRAGQRLALAQGQRPAPGL